MAIQYKPGQMVRVTVSKTPTRASAVKTIERLFLKDKAIANPLHVRSSHFEEIPKRRGGCIWTKRPNKIHPNLGTGVSATILATPQAIKDLNSVSTFVTVEAK